MLPFGEKKQKPEGQIKAQMGDICMLIITHRHFSADAPLIPLLW